MDLPEEVQMAARRLQARTGNAKANSQHNLFRSGARLLVTTELDEKEGAKRIDITPTKTQPRKPQSQKGQTGREPSR